jgi:excisionase family DNA binding protein
MDDSPALLRRSEAADRLRVSTRTVRRWGSTGRLDERHLTGQTVRVTEESVDALVRGADRDRAGAAT